MKKIFRGGVRELHADFSAGSREAAYADRAARSRLSFFSL